MAKLAEAQNAQAQEQRAQTKEQYAQAKKLAELSAKVALDKPGFGLHFNAAVGIHVLRPYGQKLFTVGGELLLMPVLDDTWRLVLGLGGAYSGQDNDEDDMGIVAPYIGLEKHFGGADGIVYLDFGALAEVRVDDTGKNEFGSYGARIAPQFCFGKIGQVCLGPNVALMATHFYGQKTDEVFWDADAVFGFILGGHIGR